MNDYHIQFKKRIVIEMISGTFIFLLILLINLPIYLTAAQDNNTGTSALQSNFGRFLMLPIIVMVMTFIPYALFRIISEYFIGFSFGNKEIRFSRGILARSEKTIPYSKIQHIITFESLLQRWFGVVTVSIDTARESSHSGDTRTLDVGPDIPDLDADDAVDLIKRLTSEMSRYNKSGI